MKTRKQKKGFTIVELVIVLAVVGVLAAILIPTFTNIINKANTAKDQSLVYNLNEALILEEIDHNGKYDTMHDTLTAMDKNQGFGINRIKVTSKNSEILWDSVNNRFVMVTKNGNEAPTYYNGTDEINYPDLKGENKIYEVDLWRISDTVDENSPYSTYYTGDATTVTTSKGFDAGNSNVTEVTYNGGNSAQNVVVRTNGGTLTINGYVDSNDPTKGDTVQHYGEAEKVDVVSMAKASYHENGEVDLIKVKKGHVELETGAQVLGVYVYTEDAEAGFADIKITVNQGAEIPQLSRSAVQIAETGTKVCTVVTDQAKDIYLFNQGIYEQIKVADEGAAKSTAQWVDDVEKSGASENTQNAAWQLANEYNGRNSDGSISAETITIETTTYKVMLDDETRTFETFKQVVTIDPDTNEQVVTDVKMTSSQIAEVEGLADEVSDKKGAIQTNVDQSGSSEADAVADLPLKGDGLSWETAFEIYDYNTMQKITDYYNVGPRYYKVVIEKTDDGHIDCLNDWYPVYLNGYFDGAGVIFNNLDAFLFNSIKNSVVSISNITANVNINGGDQYGRAAGILWYSTAETYFSNVNVHGYIYANNVAASYIGWTRYNTDTVIYFNNCYSDVELHSAGGAGGFIGHTYGNPSTDSIDIYFKDSLFEGTMEVGGTTSTHNYVYGQSCNVHNSDTTSAKIFMDFSTNSLMTRFTNVCCAKLVSSSEVEGYAYRYAPDTTHPFNQWDASHETTIGLVGAYNYLRCGLSEINYHNGSDLVKGETVTIDKNSNATKARAYFEIGPNNLEGWGNYTGTYIGPVTLDVSGNTLTTTGIYYCDININADGALETGYNTDNTVFNVVNNSYGTTYGSARIIVVQYKVVEGKDTVVQMDVWDLTK